MSTTQKQFNENTQRSKITEDDIVRVLARDIFNHCDLNKKDFGLGNFEEKGDNQAMSLAIRGRARLLFDRYSSELHPDSNFQSQLDNKPSFKDVSIEIFVTRAQNMVGRIVGQTNSNVLSFSSAPASISFVTKEEVAAMLKPAYPCFNDGSGIEAVAEQERLENASEFFVLQKAEDLIGGRDLKALPAHETTPSLKHDT